MSVQEEGAPTAKRPKTGLDVVETEEYVAAVGIKEEADMEEQMSASPEGETDTYAESFAEMKASVLFDHSREEMLAALFEAWDRDGNGRLSFEEVLPHYLKCARHHNLLEPEVRASFEHFMTSQGRCLDDGITLDLFHKWLGKLSDDQVAAHYVRHVRGWSRRPYKMNIGHTVVKEFKYKSLQQILDSPVHALCGLSDLADGALAPLGLHTVRDLGTWRCFLIARAICELAAKESTGRDYQPADGHGLMNIRNALQEIHANATLKHVMHLPVSALSMFPEQGLAALDQINIKTIKHLGHRKYFIWANAMVELERFETERREP
mmetsp:Transcript_34623/g.95385  ORF Transcript_34623/g.95385 Transcript_34623/m.95385 type:complete len:322 (-) Transcript_34623:214-1179(-)